MVLCIEQPRGNNCGISESNIILCVARLRWLHLEMSSDNDNDNDNSVLQGCIWRCLLAGDNGSPAPTGHHCGATAADAAPKAQREYISSSEMHHMLIIN